MNTEEEVKIRTSWEVCVAVGERFAFLAEQLADALPEVQRKQAQRLAEHMKAHLVAYMDEAIDLITATGIDYMVL